MVTSPGPMMVTDADYEVTGDLTPDVTGNYAYAGEYGGKPSYYLMDNGWFIWWDIAGRWAISSERGVTGGDWWSRVDPDIEGLYGNEGTALGNATVAEI